MTLGTAKQMMRARKLRQTQRQQSVERVARQ